MTDAEFAKLAKTVSKDARVDPPEMAKAKGFGSKGLKVQRKLFAFAGSKGKLVLKLPGARVDAKSRSGFRLPALELQHKLSQVSGFKGVS